MGFLRFKKPPVVVVEVDKDIVEYYVKLIPKNVSYTIPTAPPHIVVSDSEKIQGNWGNLEGKKTSFEYENYVHSDKDHFWLNAYSDTIGEIRDMLGLPNVSSYKIIIANKG